MKEILQIIFQISSVKAKLLLHAQPERDATIVIPVKCVFCNPLCSGDFFLTLGIPSHITGTFGGKFPKKCNGQVTYIFEIHAPNGVWGCKIQNQKLKDPGVSVLHNLGLNYKNYPTVIIQMVPETTTENFSSVGALNKHWKNGF